MFYGARKYVDRKVFTNIAKRYNKTNNQVLLRWAVQKQFQIIPKSKSEARIRENATIFDFELSEADMEEMSTLEEVDIDQYWNPLEDDVDLGHTTKYAPIDVMAQRSGDKS